MRSARKVHARSARTNHRRCPERFWRRLELVVVDTVRSLAQRLCKSIGLALRQLVEERDNLINDGAPIRLRSDVGGDEALGLDAEGSVDVEAGLARPIGLPATCQLQSIAKPLSVDANAVP